MNTRRSFWLLVLALITQLLSPAVRALSISDNGIWSVSCAGKLHLLPLPGDKRVNTATPGDCSLCCDEPRNIPDAFIATENPTFAGQSANTYTYLSSAETASQRIKTCPARAPPALQ